MQVSLPTKSEEGGSYATRCLLPVGAHRPPISDSNPSFSRVSAIRGSVDIAVSTEQVGKLDGEPVKGGGPVSY